jgi:hypothetical protein
MVQPEPRPPQRPKDEPPEPDRDETESDRERTPPEDDKRIERYPER